MCLTGNQVVITFTSQVYLLNENHAALLSHHWMRIAQVSLLQRIQSQEGLIEHLGTHHVEGTGNSHPLKQIQKKGRTSENLNNNSCPQTTGYHFLYPQILQRCKVLVFSNKELIEKGVEYLQSTEFGCAPAHMHLRLQRHQIREARHG